jgi:hypothetical protein
MAEIGGINSARQSSSQKKNLCGLSCIHSGRYPLTKRGNTATCHLHHRCIPIEGRDNNFTAETHVSMPLLAYSIIEVGGTEGGSNLPPNTMVTGSMVFYLCDRH